MNADTVAADAAHWFAKEVHPHDSSLKAYVRSAFPSVHEWEDVVQESYLRVWKAKSRLPIHCAPAFLFSVARRVALDLVRKRKHAPFEVAADYSGADAATEEPGIRFQVSAAEKADLLGEALALLPPRQREVMILCKYEGMTHGEAARKMNLSIRTVGEHLVQAMRRLEKELRRRGLDGYFES